MQGGDAGGSSGRDDVAGGEGKVAGQVGDQGGDGEQHLRRVHLLLDCIVHGQSQRQVLRVGNLVGSHEAGTQGSECIIAFREEPGQAFSDGPLLLVPGGDVVEQCVSGDEAQGLGFADVFTRHPDHHGQLTLKVDVADIRRQDDRLARRDHAGGRFLEDDRLARHIAARLFRMFGVVAPDAENPVRAGQGSGESDARFRPDLVQYPGLFQLAQGFAVARKFGNDGEEVVGNAQPLRSKGFGDRDDAGQGKGTALVENTRKDRLLRIVELTVANEFHTSLLSAILCGNS